MKIQFLGGAGTVTGSRTLVEAGSTRILVDCGMYQGFKDLRLRNWERPTFEPSSIDAVVLTHAHLDHSGWIPRLIREGFRGPIYCSTATREVARLLLLDAGYLQEEDADRANQGGWSKHQPALPLYTQKDAEASLSHFRDVPWDTAVRIGDLTATLRPVGHILGASMVRIDNGRASVLFSGDVGRPNDLVMYPPKDPLESDAVVLESTYGDRLHPNTDGTHHLAEVVNKTIQRGGVVLIPAFAVGRSQLLLRALQLLKQRHEIPDVPVVLDSPMAQDCTELYVKYEAEHRLTAEESAALWSGVEITPTAEDSERVSHRKGPMVVISAAGMLTGGRVLHHLRAFAGDKRNTLLFSGFQAGGTRGAQILSGTREIMVHGRPLEIVCEVERLDAMSAHADRDELLDWLQRCPSAPSRLWLNHGEPAATDALRHAIRHRFGWDVQIAREKDIAVLAEPARKAPTAAVAVEPSEIARRQERLQASPSFRRADDDPAWLQLDAQRPIRLMLEYLKVEEGLAGHNIDATLVVFGSVRIQDPEDRWYKEARELGRLAASEPVVNHTKLVVTTGGGPGIMEAANRGAAEAGEPTVGLTIALPHEQVPNAWVTPDLAFRFRYFAVRKMHFMRRAKALVVFPGGFGTLDELTDALTLIQTGKMPTIPVVLVGREHWGHVIDFGYLVEQGFIDAAHVKIVQHADDAAGAWEIIKRFYREQGRRGAWAE